MGNIKVKNVATNLKITTESGLCDVEFAELGSVNDFTFNAKNGSLKATNINRAVNINIQNDGVCALDLTYKKIKGNNVINAQKGKVNVVAPIQKCVLTVNTSAKKDISYADIVSTENIDANLILGATADTQDKLTISSSTGAVTLKSLVTE